LLRLFFADASMFNVAQRSSRMLSPTYFLFLASAGRVYREKYAFITF
jgi:hypothetical protein